MHTREHQYNTQVFFARDILATFRTRRLANTCVVTCSSSSLDDHDDYVNDDIPRGELRDRVCIIPHVLKVLAFPLVDRLHAVHLLVHA